MAVVKANFIKRDKYDKNKAKAHIRYIQHRQGKDGERIIRTLFNNDGTMEREEAYRMIVRQESAMFFFASLLVRIQLKKIRVGILICATLRREL